MTAMLAVALRQLAYVGLRVRDMASWRRLLTEVVGCAVRDVDAAGLLRFRMDDRHHRIALHESEDEGLAHLGFEVEDGAALSAFAARLAAEGVDVSWGTPAQCRERSVSELVSFVDPSGFDLEVCHGAAVDPRPFRPGRQMTGFKAGSLGFGHVVISTPLYDETTRFYGGSLGLLVSDYIDPGYGMDATFYHCNPRHHSLAVLRETRRDAVASLHHIAVEVGSVDDVGRALDLCLQRDIPVSQGIGRHTNDLMTSFYMVTPSGFQLEYGAGGRLIDDATWEIQHYNSPSIWGHHRLIDPSAR